MQTVEEEFAPGHKRLFEVLKEGFVRISISHRLTSAGYTPEQWSCWYLFGHAESLEKAKEKHDKACSNGPW